MTQSLLAEPRRRRRAVRRASRAARWSVIPLADTGRGQRAPRPGAGGGRNRLPARALRRTGPRPARRRTDDVRAGQFRALPAQDLQRQLDHRRRREQPHSLFKMIKNTHAQTPRAHAVGVQRQRGGGRRLSRPRASAPIRRRQRIPRRSRRPTARSASRSKPTTIRPRSRRSPARRTGAGGEIRDEGATGRGGQPEGRPDRLLGLAPAHPDAAAAVGERARAESAHGPGAGNHARRPARRRRVQQRIRPPEPDRLFPQLRTARRRRPAWPAPTTSRSCWPAASARSTGRWSQKLPLRAGDAVIVLGGPAMLIGLGGGAASSVASGDSSRRTSTSPRCSATTRRWNGAARK